MTLVEMLPGLISDRAMSCLEIAEATGRDRNRVWNVLERECDRGNAHIQGWRRNQGHPTALYILQPGKDSPRPVPLTSEEKCRMYRKTIKGKATRKTARTKAKPEIRGLKSIDPLLAAIMGVK